MRLDVWTWLGIIVWFFVALWLGMPLWAFGLGCILLMILRARDERRRFLR